MTNSMDGRATRPRLDRGLAVRLALPALILVVAVAAHLAAVAWGERREEENIRARAEAAAAHLAARIAQYGDALYGVRGLFAASDEVTHREFRESMDAAAVARRFPGVRAISFAPLIAAGDIRARERAHAPGRRAQRDRAIRGWSCRPRAAGRRSRRSPTSSRSRATSAPSASTSSSEPGRADGRRAHAAHRDARGERADHASSRTPTGSAAS